MDESFCENSNSAYNFEKHWENAYRKIPVKSLGWYEFKSKPTLELIEQCNLEKDALIFNAGVGASTLIRDLIEANYSNLVVNDIAVSALTELKQQIGNNKNTSIKFIVSDLTNPSNELLKLKNVDLWNDRAVLHFFTTKKQQTAYFNLLKKVVKKNGFVILAEFNLEGAKKCCGLNVVNYNEAMLQEQLGNEFKLLQSFNYTYTQPKGDTREYVYTLFKRSTI
ncbi:Methyltransferase domain-containing protein [Lutibacter oricola]|uniref:Methyltransferase domain-containing protein n=1 Tax=Lutibacter oricola TaxID=762486 RepID=A0A1H3ALB5_9FLAO|nr:class I SAM-dependent methyltransferase [Lutibacter oricola]SDX30502.1 Methyltransferase domain-containing protein [Lutibacter oricola]